MKRTTLTTLLASSLALSMGLAAVAKNSISTVEKNRVCEIAQDGMAEVKLGKLAESKGSSAEIKSFAKKMVTDHTDANNKLKEAAAKEGITLPADVNEKQKATFQELSNLSGKAFDEKYMAEMVKGHDKAVAAIGTESQDGTGQFKVWAEETITTIKSHDKLAKNVDKNVSE